MGVIEDPESFFIDVGYRDPLDDNEPRPERDLPSAEELAVDPAVPMRELGRTQLERELVFGSGVRQVIASDELLRRAGDGYQPSLLEPHEGRRG